MSKLSDALITQAVLKAFELNNTAQVAELFDIDERDLIGYQRNFVQMQAKRLDPQQGEETGIDEKPNAWERLRKNPFFDISFKVMLTLLLIAICWLIPFELQPFVDPLTNTVIWLGFTAAYLTALGGLILDLIFWTQHPANFDFLNPFTRPGGSDDYQTIILGNLLTPYEKCRLNQQKYLAYFFAYCLILLALASLTHG